MIKILLPEQSQLEKTYIYFYLTNELPALEERKTPNIFTKYCENNLLITGQVALSLREDKTFVIG